MLANPFALPFQSLAVLAPKQQKQWLEECYVAAEVHSVLRDPQRSVVAVAEAGSGISTSLTWLQLQMDHSMFEDEPDSQDRFLAFSYAPDRWLSTQSSAEPLEHLRQFMWQIADACMRRFKIEPQLLAACPVYVHQMLIWMARFYMGERRAEAWLRALERSHPSPALEALIEAARSGDLDYLHASDTPDALRDQINECLEMLEYFAWHGAYAIIDISTTDWIERTADERSRLREGVELLLRQLGSLQQPGFGFKLGVPPVIVSAARAQELSRSRVTVQPHVWTTQQLWMIAHRRYVAITGARIDFNTLMSAQVWAQIEHDMKNIWGSVCPASMVALVHALVEHMDASETADLAHYLPELRFFLYQHYAPLRRDRNGIEPLVWRGATPIALDDAQIKMFDLLWQYQGNVVPNAVLHAQAGSAHNADKIISRLRQALEPFSERHVYLHRVTSYGAYLDQSSCRFL